MTWYIRIRQIRAALAGATKAAGAAIYAHAPQLWSVVGVVLVGVGVAQHDLGAGLAIAGCLVIGLVIFSVLLPRFLKDC